MDKITAGSLAGLGAGIVIGLISLILYLSGICRMCLITIGGGIVRQEMLTADAATPTWLLFGWTTHLIISVLLGIFLTYLLYLTGRDFALLKGIIFGAAAWFIDIVIISPPAGYIPRSAADPGELLILLAGHMLFGLLTAWLLCRYAKSALTPSP